MDAPLSLEEIRRLSGASDAEWIDPPLKAAYRDGDAIEELRPRQMLAVGGLVLVEAEDEPGKWWMGQEADGIVWTWGTYGRLEDALLISSRPGTFPHPRA